MVWKEIEMEKSSPVLLKVSIKNKIKPDGCHMSVIAALGWGRQENWEFEAILSHMMSLSVLDHITSHLRQASSLQVKPAAGSSAAKLSVNLVLVFTVL